VMMPATKKDCLFFFLTSQHRDSMISAPSTTSYR
jgi:hypothetical protein